MRARLRPRLTYANVVATGALCIAVAGGGTAVADPIVGTAGALRDTASRALGLAKKANARSKTALRAARTRAYSKAQSDARFLGLQAKAVDADQLDGRDSAAFLGRTEAAADSAKLEGLASSAFLRSSGKAVDADQLDGLDATAFLRTGTTGLGAIADNTAAAGQGSENLAANACVDKSLLYNSGSAPSGSLVLTFLGSAPSGLVAVPVVQSATSISAPVRLCNITAGTIAIGGVQYRAYAIRP